MAAHQQEEVELNSSQDVGKLISIVKTLKTWRAGSMDGQSYDGYFLFEVDSACCVFIWQHFLLDALPFAFSYILRVEQWMRWRTQSTSASSLDQTQWQLEKRRTKLK